MTYVLSVVVLFSPLWSKLTSPVFWDPTINAVACVLYLATALRVVRDLVDVDRVVRLLALFGTGYALYFIQQSSALEFATSSVVTRQALEEANANYTGAILALTLACTLWHLLARKSSLAVRGLFLALAVPQVSAIIATGSRATLTAAVLTASVLVVQRFWAHLATAATAIVATISFWIGLFPEASAFFRDWSSKLANYGTFNREAADIAELSGRDRIWQETREVFSSFPLLGWGPDRYRGAQESTHMLAHSWGLEYLVSVGLLGTTIIVAIYVLAFRGNGQGDPSWTSLRNALVFSAIPNLTLSTHQWTLWTWLTVGLVAATAYLPSAKGSVIDAEAPPSGPSTSSPQSVRQPRRHS